MANLNPNNILMLLRQGNPRAAAELIIQTDYANDPNAQYLLHLAQKGDTKTLEQIAQQTFNSQGRNYSAELQNMMNLIKSM